MACQEVQETEEHVGVTSQQNLQLQAQLSLLALSGKGDGIDKEKDEEVSQPNMTIAEDLES
jgi:hypothetical protein